MKYFSFQKVFSLTLVCLVVSIFIGCGSDSAKTRVAASSANAFPMSIGDFVTPWELKNMNHKPEPIPYRSSDHPNGIFVVEGYFRSCGLCNWNATNVNALADDYRSQERVQVLDVGIDGPERVYEQWIEETEANHPVLRDLEGVLIHQIDFAAYPSVAIIDCHMKIRYKHQGYWEAPTQKEVRDVVEMLLKESCTKDQSFINKTYIIY